MGAIEAEPRHDPWSHDDQKTEVAFLAFADKNHQRLKSVRIRKARKEEARNQQRSEARGAGRLPCKAIAQRSEARRVPVGAPRCLGRPDRFRRWGRYETPVDTRLLVRQDAYWSITLPSRNPSGFQQVISEAKTSLSSFL